MSMLPWSPLLRHWLEVFLPWSGRSGAKLGDLRVVLSHRPVSASVRSHYHPLMDRDLDLMQFIEGHVASAEEWEEYRELDGVKDPGRVGLVGLKREQLPSGLLRRRELERSFQEQLEAKIATGDWVLKGRWSSGGFPLQIELSVLRKLRLEPHRNRAEGSGGNYVDLRLSPSRPPTPLQRAVELIEGFCARNSHQDNAKKDVADYVRKQVAISDRKFGHAWTAAVIPEEWRKSGRRGAKARRRLE